MNNMKISVVISTYNGERYIEEQLYSILRQTRRPDEVLIFDDCSTDKTCELVSSFIKANTLSEWKLIDSKINRGWKKNFKLAMTSTTGDLIFPCDQDDIWMSNKLEIMEKLMQKNPRINVLTCGYEAFYNDGRKICHPDRYSDQIIKQKIRQDVFTTEYPGCTYAIRKSFIDTCIPYWEDDFPHDAVFWRCGFLSESLFTIATPLICWRKHVDSTYARESLESKSHIAKREWMDYATRVLNELTKFVTDNPVPNPQKAGDILKREQKWLEYRKKFFDTRNPLYGLNLVEYLNCYSRPRQYIGDWLLAYR